MSEIDKIESCLIWTDSPATADYSPVYDGRSGEIISVRWEVDSPRAGGLYSANNDMPFPNVNIDVGNLDEDARARLTTLLVDLRNQNDEAYVPNVTKDLIERARRARPLDVDVRAERLLRFIGKQSKSIGDVMTFNAKAPTDIYRQAMAWSESTSARELRYLLDYLSDDQQRWMERKYQTGTSYCVTVDGYRRIAEVKTNLDSAQAFVAMWFDDGMDDAYSNGIEPAIRDAGYRPVRIDRKPDVNKIDDEIIAGIRRSRFLVADFTHGKDGARGGVYFEAGFAFGLNIPVIHTCREDAIDQIHFDTRQYHHTAWSRPDELRTKLKNRILALIGEGPVRSDTGP